MPLEKKRNKEDIIATQSTNVDLVASSVVKLQLFVTNIHVHSFLYAFPGVFTAMALLHFISSD